MPSFVNPYTFVSMPPTVQRGPGAGHDRLGDGRLSGALRVQLEALTPLLLGAVQGQTGPQPPQRASDDAVFIVGSALHGTFRALHETMVGGCMRVIDLDYAPVHRQPVNTTVTAGLRLATVTKVESGRAIEVIVAPEANRRNPVSTAWFRLADLRRGLGNSLESGIWFSTSAERFDTKGARTQCVQAKISPAAPHTPGAWQLLITDTSARDPKNTAYFVAARNFGSPVPVTPEAWAQYREESVGADDQRPGNTNTEKFPAVTWPPDSDSAERIGSRFRADSIMSVGQPVWVRVAPLPSRVVHLQPAQVWRYKATGAVRDRLPDDALPCHDPAELCPSCRIFGSADTRNNVDRDVAEQNSYSGHVRFGDAVVVGEATVATWMRAPLMSPKPSAGQFYLSGTGLSREQRRGESGAAPRAHWGSAADSPRRRNIRGRKFYWRTTDPETGAFPRGKARQHQADSPTVQEVTLVQAGTKFEFTVAFDNLTRSQLGGLLACVEPALLFNDADDVKVVSIGGGKPFGFGSTATTVTVEVAEDATTRYLGDTGATPIRIPELIEEFSTSIAQPVKSLVWPELRAALTMGQVRDADVWYPPGPGVRGSKEYDEGFEFWANSAGVSSKRGPASVRTSMTGLPSPTAEDQRIDLSTPLRDTDR